MVGVKFLKFLRVVKKWKFSTDEGAREQYVLIVSMVTKNYQIKPLARAEVTKLRPLTTLYQTRWWHCLYRSFCGYIIMCKMLFLSTTEVWDLMTLSSQDTSPLFKTLKLLYYSMIVVSCSVHVLRLQDTF